MPGCFPLVDAEKSRSQRLALMAILTWGLQGGGGSPTWRGGCWSLPRWTPESSGSNKLDWSADPRGWRHGRRRAMLSPPTYDLPRQRNSSSSPWVYFTIWTSGAVMRIKGIATYTFASLAILDTFLDILPVGINETWCREAQKHHLRRRQEGRSPWLGFLTGARRSRWCASPGQEIQPGDGDGDGLFISFIRTTITYLIFPPGAKKSIRTRKGKFWARLTVFFGANLSTFWCKIFKPQNVKV